MKRRLLIFLGVALAAAVVVAVLLRSPPNVAPIRSNDVETLRKADAKTRPEKLQGIAEACRTGESVPQVLLVQVVENGRVLVVAVPSDDVSDDEAATGWEIPWEPARDAIRGEPEKPLSATSSDSRFHYRHDIIPVSRDDGLYLLVNSASQSPPWTGWRGAALILATLLMVIGWRSEE